MLKSRKRYDVHIENVLGTSLQLLLAAHDRDAAREAERVALEEIDRLTRILSSYSPDSEFAQWQETLESDIAVSDELLEMLEAAESWWRKTNGAFNAGASAIAACLTAGDQVTGVVSRVQEPLWRIDTSRRTARRLVDMSMSLDAIAKGFIVARAGAAVAALSGIADVLLNIGGDIQHFGNGAHQIGITDPRQPAENGAAMSKVRIHNEAIATSGGYRRGFIANGVQHSHIIDPRTGHPATGIISASVIAADCATADALSTAFSVLRPDESVDIANGIGGVSCLLLSRDGTLTTNSLWDHHESITL